MNLYLVLPLFLGFSVVTQGILNRKIAAEWGLPSTVLLNAAVFFILSGILFLLTRVFPEYFPDYLRVHQFNLQKTKYWFLFPGMCGFFLVLGVPWALQNIGPSKTFILLIVAQTVLSVMADKWIFHTEVSMMKLVGSIVALMGALIVSAS